jgi:hypothetical protein
LQVAQYRQLQTFLQWLKDVEEDRKANQLLDQERALERVKNLETVQKLQQQELQRVFNEKSLGLVTNEFHTKASLKMAHDLEEKERKRLLDEKLKDDQKENHLLRFARKSSLAQVIEKENEERMRLLEDAWVSQRKSMLSTDIEYSKALMIIDRERQEQVQLIEEDDDIQLSHRRKHMVLARNLEKFEQTRRYFSDFVLAEALEVVSRKQNISLAKQLSEQERYRRIFDSVMKQILHSASSESDLKEDS